MLMVHKGTSGWLHKFAILIVRKLGKIHLISQFKVSQDAKYLFSCRAAKDNRFDLRILKVSYTTETFTLIEKLRMGDYP